MREEKVLITGRSCSECLHPDGRITHGNKNQKSITREFREENSCKMSLTAHRNFAKNREKTNINTVENRDNHEENMSSAQSWNVSLPQVIITRPFSDRSETTEVNNYQNDTPKNEDDDDSEDGQKNESKIAGRRSLPEITISCPPVEVFDCQEDENPIDDGIFTRRRYMICRDSPRSGKKKISLVDFPHGLSEMEGNESLYLESPANSLESPYSFSNVDLTFTYNSPLGSPFTPPFTPEMTRPSKFIYPGPVPVFSIEQSFPPAGFKDNKLTAE